MSGTTLAGVGAVLGALAGAISFLFKALIASKDGQIKSLETDVEYWRTFALGLLEPADRAVSLAERVLPMASRRRGA